MQSPDTSYLGMTRQVDNVLQSVIGLENGWYKHVSCDQIWLLLLFFAFFFAVIVGALCVTVSQSALRERHAKNAKLTYRLGSTYPVK